ncbi:uncharacterized protein EI90DRAFT_3061452 [Cantharellus anzutake]|uniref:uncharacterized protein n=1 Tax=Cantharellus anzutake TaxID=1750568 RepID=UPI0019031731|nr:uncharacterized protein EI90DRAFT_3061452 [Cantharellus anzutake]KAF8330066.1 hypothetical protein EI90DRAFT_3061452 [Cantharellus anzutake]
MRNVCKWGIKLNVPALMTYEGHKPAALSNHNRTTRPEFIPTSSYWNDSSKGISCTRHIHGRNTFSDIVRGHKSREDRR